jgi:hypothetical protein
MKRGVILIAVLGTMIFLLSISISFFSYVVHEKKASDRTLGLVKAFYIAEAGLDRAIARLKAGLSGEVSEVFGEGEYNVSVINVAGLVYRLDSVGEAKDNQGNVLASRRLSIYVKDTPFNTYSYLTDNEYFTLRWCWGWWCWSWQVPVWFITGDRLQGPVFSNSEFHISGSPEFYGPVKASEIIYMHGGPPQDNPYFDSSYEPNPLLGVSSIDLPSFDEPNLERLTTEGMIFEGDTIIVFKDDGTMDVTNTARGWTNYNIPLPEEKGIFVDGGNLYVSGVLKGEVTLGAGTDSRGRKGNVVITDNVRFSDRYDEEGRLRTSPLLPDDSSDYLGIVAEKDVIISKDAPHDLEIDASIMALGDSFIVERWWDSRYNKGTLMILGGIIQKERGPVGTFSRLGKVSGYSKNYIYDERLNQTSLPYFPTTGEYKVISWKRNE